MNIIDFSDSAPEESHKDSTPNGTVSTEDALRAALRSMVELAEKLDTDSWQHDKDEILLSAHFALSLPATTTVQEVASIPEGAKPIFHLPDRYKPALIGITVDPRTRPRFVYSLCKLVLATEVAEKVPEREAQDIVFNMILNSVTQWGDNSPLFIDDTLSASNVIIKPYLN